ncbi:MAG: chemotaxis protein CheX [Myxococcota bacterium]|nr:chemotaxis protein CheX [Myxococcota bacterium]
MPTTAVAGRWLGIALEAAQEVGTGSLDLAPEFVDARDRDRSQVSSGAYIPIICGREKLHIGMASTEQGCIDLTRALLCMEPDEDDPTQEDVADAVSEIVNILAGIMQRMVPEDGPQVELGLPIFINGGIVACRLDTELATIQYGNTVVDITVISGGTLPEDS